VDHAESPKTEAKEAVSIRTEHSGDLVHEYWHRTSEDHPYVIIWLDDASRMALAGGEFVRATHVESIEQSNSKMRRTKHWSSISRYER